MSTGTRPANVPSAAPGIARIDPQRCIGCARCIEACPFDAIMGAPQRMHTVIGEECIGCELCIAPCPVDCIELVSTPMTAPSARQRAVAARRQRRQRLVRHEREKRAQASIGSDLSALMATALQRAGERK